MSVAPNIAVTFGTTSGGSPVSGIVDPGTAWNLVTVTLSANYIQQDPGGPLPGHFPTRPYIGAPGTVWSPGTILSGNRRQYWSCEAAAIVAAGIGSYS